MSMMYGFPTGVSAKLPYQPAIDEILYVEGKHTVKIDRWRIEYYSEIIKYSLQNPAEYAEGYFSMIVKLLNEPSVWNGLTEEQQSEIKSEILCDFSLTEYIQSGREIVPSLFVYHSKQRDGRYRFQQFEIGTEGIWETIQEVFAYMDFKDESYGLEYKNQSELPLGRDELVRQMQQCAKQLIEMGMDKEDIVENIFESKIIMPLLIRKEGKIHFDGYTKEIKLSPLDKAIYLLYLRHPEGINFSYLPDYREELLEIYRKLMPHRTTASMQRSIEDVTDPTKNSINEKCARIRREFINVVGKYQADYYCILGERGGIKKIALDRSLVKWEEE